MATGTCWPQAQCAQDFMECMTITLAKLGSRGRQSKVNQWWPQELPVWGHSPRSPQGAARLGLGTQSHLCAQGWEHRGGEVQPQSPQQWQSFPALLSHSLGTGKSTAALLVPALHEGWVGFSLDGMPCHHCLGS